MNMPPYSMEMVWSDDDRCFVVSLPEWGDLAKAFGDTYEEAVRNGQEALQGLIESYQIEGRPLPEPRKSVA